MAKVKSSVISNLIFISISIIGLVVGLGSQVNYQLAALAVPTVITLSGIGIMVGMYNMLKSMHKI